MTESDPEEWIEIDVLLGMPLPNRIKYVRTNLKMGQVAFAATVGTSGREIVSRWERVERPTRPGKTYAEAIAALTPEYPPEAFGAEGEAELVRRSLGTRLRRLEERFDAFVEAASERRAANEKAPARSKPRSARRSPRPQDAG